MHTERLNETSNIFGEPKNGLAFGIFASGPAKGQTSGALDLQVQTASERIRQQPIDRIAEDSHRTAAILSEVVQSVVSELRSEMSTKQIDNAILDQILARGLLPSMLGYRGFPAASALSVGPAFSHSPPSEQVISESDLLTIQVSASSDLSHASLGVTVPVGCPSAADAQVLEGCRQALENAVGVVRAGIRTGEISHEIQQSLEAYNLYPIRDFVGYSMGQERIQAPQIFGYGPRNRGEYIEAGMILNIHVIGTAGEPLTRIEPDNWTALTRDCSTAALATAMVLVEEHGGTVLTTIPRMDLDECANLS